MIVGRRVTCLFVCLLFVYLSDAQVGPQYPTSFIPHALSLQWCPFMVSLTQPVEGVLQQCGGSVLTNTLTLTAAHCLIHGTYGLRLRFGSVYLLYGGWLLQATKIISHSAFDPQILDNDIGLVSIFPAVLKFGFSVLPVRIPMPYRSPVPVNMFLVIYGWGATSDSESFSVQLRGAALPVVSRELCRKTLMGFLPPKATCMGYYDGRIDACMGDSGGPAMLGDLQIGITSFGEGCALPYKYGVYTDVTKYVDWILTAIANEPRVIYL